MSKKKNKIEERCLCGNCACDYEISGYEVKRDYSVDKKERCSKCGRFGFMYIIKAPN